MFFFEFWNKFRQNYFEALNELLYSFGGIDLPLWWCLQKTISKFQVSHGEAHEEG